MRLSVRVPAQNALFRRMRFSSPGQTWRRLTEKRTLPPTPHGKAHSATCISRKSTFCNLRLTEKHILQPTPHGKAHSVIPRSRRMCFSVTSRHPGGVGHPPRQAVGHYGEWLNWANALEQPPHQAAGRLARGSADLGLGLTSRKSALCNLHLTEKRTLRAPGQDQDRARTGPRRSKFLSSGRRAAILRLLCVTALWLPRLMSW